MLQTSKQLTVEKKLRNPRRNLEENGVLSLTKLTLKICAIHSRAFDGKTFRGSNSKFLMTKKLFNHVIQPFLFFRKLIFNSVY